MKKVLVRLPNWLGDIVMASGFLHQLRARLAPGDRLEVLLKTEHRAMAELLTDVDAIHTFEKNKIRSPRGFLKLAEHLRSQGYSHYFSLPDSFSSALLGRMAKIPVRVGRQSQLRTKLLTLAPTYDPKTVHRADGWNHLLDALGSVAPLPLLPSLKIPDVSDSLEIKDTVFVNFCSEAQSRRMPLPKARSILKDLLEHTNWNLSLTGAPKDHAFIAEILEPFEDRQRIVNLAGHLSLEGLSRKLLTQAIAFLSTDSGPAHLAAALNVPTLVLFGAGHEKQTAPRGKIVNILRLTEVLPCAPCGKNKCQLSEVSCLIKIENKILLENLQKLSKN